MSTRRCEQLRATLARPPCAPTHLAEPSPLQLSKPPQACRAAPPQLSIKLYLKNVVPIFRSVHGVTKVWIQIAHGEGAAPRGAT